MIYSDRSTRAINSHIDNFILSVPLVQKSSSPGTEYSDEFIVASLLCSVRLIFKNGLLRKTLCCQCLIFKCAVCNRASKRERLLPEFKLSIIYVIYILDELSSFTVVSLVVLTIDYFRILFN